MSVTKDIKDKIAKIPAPVWIFLAIMVFGVILRTYHHRQWLYFDDDQANDAFVVDNFIQGKTGLPLLGPNMGNTKFRIGPVFYYFEILSAEAFGSYPDKLAYPDLLLSILTIPLLYFFLSRYFTRDHSLILTGLYTVSYFAIKFSRFAWNTNSMPFFILLFLLGLHEILILREKTPWRWVLGLGVSLGIGIQLHAMLLVIFPIMALGVLVWTLKTRPAVWRKWLIVILIAFILNAGQIIYELKNDFENTRAFFNISDHRSGSGLETFSWTLASDAACHIQANTYILAVLGNKDNCDFLDTRISKETHLRHPAFLDDPVYFSIVVLSLVFSVWGYFILAARFVGEKGRNRKYFLGIVIAFLALFFIIMFPSIKEAPLRYFLPVFFVPYLFLGFIFEWVGRILSGKAAIAICLISFLIAACNISYQFHIVKELRSGARSGKDDVILGELEKMRDYIISQSSHQNSAYFLGDTQYTSRFYRPMQYLAQKNGFEIERTGKIDRIEPDKQVFYIAKNKSLKNAGFIEGFGISDRRDFGAVSIYKLSKEP